MRIMRQYYYFVFCLLLLLTSSQELFSKIVINEIMSSNSKTLQDEDSAYPDWIELYNSGDSSVNLEGWYLTDDNKDAKWKFPAVFIAPDKYLIVFCSDKDKFDGINIHTNFKIKSEGETIRLLDQNLIVVDKIPPVKLSTDLSYGRIPDGTCNFSMFLNPSPGETNNNNTPMNLIEFSHNGGFFLHEFDLSINKVFSDDEFLNDDIYYTLDGSEPNDNSFLYTEPLKIKNKRVLNYR